METGTGKTYVYLRTIPELNKRCGSTKFVIVVPSVAIKEGVYKSLQMTEAHFQALYSGYFLYESGIEASFADPLQKNAAVKVYAKLPGWFRVPTPLGSYNPDWAVLIDADAGRVAVLGGRKPRATCLPATSSQHRKRQDCVWQGALQRPQRRGVTGSV